MGWARTEKWDWTPSNPSSLPDSSATFFLTPARPGLRPCLRDPHHKEPLLAHKSGDQPSQYEQNHVGFSAESPISWETPGF